MLLVSICAYNITYVWWCTEGSVRVRATDERKNACSCEHVNNFQCGPNFLIDTRFFFTPRLILSLSRLILLLLSSKFNPYHRLISIPDVNKTLWQRLMRMQPITSHFHSYLCCVSPYCHIKFDSPVIRILKLTHISAWYHPTNLLTVPAHMNVYPLGVTLYPWSNSTTQKLFLTLSWRIFQTCHYGFSKERNGPSVTMRRLVPPV